MLWGFAKCKAAGAQASHPAAAAALLQLIVVSSPLQHTHAISFIWRAWRTVLDCAARMVKCLYAGEVAGKIDVLFKRVEAVNASNGPFDALFCVGGFFAVAGERQSEVSCHRELRLSASRRSCLPCRHCRRHCRRRRRRLPLPPAATAHDQQPVHQHLIAFSQVATMPTTAESCCRTSPGRSRRPCPLISLAAGARAASRRSRRWHVRVCGSEGGRAGGRWVRWGGCCQACTALGAADPPPHVAWATVYCLVLPLCTAWCCGGNRLPLPRHIAAVQPPTATSSTWGAAG